jgi:hypothetical protein
MEKFFSPKVVLIMFAATACAGFLLGKLAPELFSGALMLVLGYFYGSKNGEKAAKAEAAGVSFNG